MAKPLPTATNPEVPRAAAASLKNKIQGKNPNFDASEYLPITGREQAAEQRPFTALLMGQSGSGKTHALIGLLRHGFKVYYLTTDYAKQGLETIYSYFVDHPEEAYLLNNLRHAKKGFSFDAVQEFSHHPDTLVPDIYDWDPDWLFWDGLTSYQEIETQNEKVSDDDFHKNSWDDWRKQKAGVVFPVDRFLCLHNTRTGRIWNKIITCGLNVKEKFTSEKKGDEWVQIPIDGSKTIGPDLNTGARAIVKFGFSLVIVCTRRVVGTNEVFGFKRIEQYLETKSRGYNSIPAVWEGKPGAPVGFYELWREHIAAKHAPFTVPNAKVETVPESPASIETQGEKE